MREDFFHKHRPYVPPSGREVDFAEQKTEGASEALRFSPYFNFFTFVALSFRQPSAATFLPEEGFFATIAFFVSSHDE